MFDSGLVSRGFLEELMEHTSNWSGFKNSEKMVTFTNQIHRLKNEVLIVPVGVPFSVFAILLNAITTADF